MDSIFSIGIQSLWDELRHMPVGGVWWVNTDRNEDAISLVNQTIAAQGKDSRVAIITMGDEPKSIITTVYFDLISNPLIVRSDGRG